MSKLRVIITLLLPALFTVSCGKIVEDSRIYSPDKKRYILRYSYRDVPWSAGSDREIAILYSGQRKKKALKNKLPVGVIDSLYWVDNNTVIVLENYIEYLLAGRSQFSERVYNVNDVTVNIIRKDTLKESVTPTIISRESSPDNQREMVLYSYDHPNRMRKIMNVSVISKGDPLPKYGNYFISTLYVKLDVHWEDNNTLAFIFPEYYDTSPDKLKYNLVKSRPDVNFSVRNRKEAVGQSGSPQ